MRGVYIRIKDGLNKFIKDVGELTKTLPKWSLIQLINGNMHTKIKESERRDIGGSLEIDAEDSIKMISGNVFNLSSKGSMSINTVKHGLIQAEQSLTLACGDAKFILQSDGSVKIIGNDIEMVSKSSIDIDASTRINIDTASSSIGVDDSAVIIKSSKISMN